MTNEQTKIIDTICQSKKQFSTRDKAVDEYRRIQTRLLNYISGKSKQTLVPYKCSGCWKWHLGHPINKNKR